MANDRSFEAFKEAALAYAEAMGLEEVDQPANLVWHLLVGLIEFCDASRVDFDHELAEVRQYFVETQPITARKPAEA